MPTLTPDAILKQLRWRYATKVFDPTRKIDAVTMAAIEQSLVLTPSSFGLQPWKFIIIRDQELKEKLTPLSWNQPQTKDCSHFVVFTYNEAFDVQEVDRYLDATVKARGGSASDHESLKNIMAGFIQAAIDKGTIDDWCKNQVYIAIGQLMACAAILGVDSCPMEGIQPEAFDEALGLKDSGFKTVVACALGYRSDSDKYATAPKVRYPKEELIVRL